MPEFERNEFKFPDEIEEDSQQNAEAFADNEPEIEVVDDTPAEDKVNSTPMPKEIVDGQAIFRFPKRAQIADEEGEQNNLLFLFLL